MWWLNVAELLLLIGGVSTCVGVICYNMRNSRCENIDICFGACKCHRKLMTPEEQEADRKNNAPTKTPVPNAGDI
jgi:hypothetical protein